MIQRKVATLEEINACYTNWYNYVNSDINKTDFETDILAFMANNSDEYNELQKNLDEVCNLLLDADKIRTKDIGDIGESLIHSHECQRLKMGGREDLIHLIKRIPSQFAVGYDIQSVDLDEKKRYIEVKTTVSSKPLNFNKIHLTPNEWNTAATMNDRYFVYRLMISKAENKLFILQDPIGLYKKDNLRMIPKDGAEITFDTKSSGNFEKLLKWEN